MHIQCRCELQAAQPRVSGPYRKGKKPNSLNADCSLTHDILHPLGTKPGPLPQEPLDQSVRAFGKKGMLLLTHYAGIYGCTNIMLNIADASASEQ